jgi:hypothetical protein
MRRTIYLIVLFYSFVLVQTGCKKGYEISEKQEIIFQYEYLNYAWGYQHSGYIIDSKGNVLSYNNPEIWNFCDKDLNLTEDQVDENLKMCSPTGKKISEQELQKYSGFIKNIASSEVTALKNVAADMGSAEYICYQFSERTGTYKKYLIKMEGDFTCENLNFHSKKVILWMKDINSGLALK